jgi:hypothetical protein
MSCHDFGNVEEYVPESDKSTFLLKDPDDAGRTECRFTNTNKNLAIVIPPSVLIGKQSTNCDFLLLNCDNNVAYFVQLKGSTEFRKATEQILFSINALKKGIVKYGTINAIIIQTKTRPNTTNLGQNFYKKFIKEISNLNGVFKHASQTHTETL